MILAITINPKYSRYTRYNYIIIVYWSQSDFMKRKGYTQALILHIQFSHFNMASIFPPEFFGNKLSSYDASPVIRNLIEFRAGKMYVEGRLCKPDPRKGLLYMKMVRRV
jgi:hypothetical protein